MYVYSLLYTYFEFWSRNEIVPCKLNMFSVDQSGYRVLSCSSKLMYKSPEQHLRIKAETLLQRI